MREHLGCNVVVLYAGGFRCWQDPEGRRHGDELWWFWIGDFYGE
jgi:hypothetical protein